MAKVECAPKGFMKHWVQEVTQFKMVWCNGRCEGLVPVAIDGFRADFVRMLAVCGLGAQSHRRCHRSC